MPILAAVAGEREQSRVVEVAHDMATAFDEELVVLHVMEQSQFDSIREDTRGGGSVTTAIRSEEGGIPYIAAGRSVSDYDLERAMADAADVARQCIRETLEERNVDVTPEGLVGDPASTIVSEADRQDARYVVVGGRKRSPAGKAVFGSVSQAVILNAERPVVTIIEDAD